jgi:AmmeMemoRadiSam system protein B
MVRSLQERFSLPCLPQAHAEHSTEVQFPFVKYYMPEAKIVEIVYSDEEPRNLAPVIEFVLEQKDWGVIISTDLSHFYTLQEAKKRDAICIAGVEKLDPHLLHAGCEACGKIGVEAMLLAAKKLSLKPTILDYRTSADASGDVQSVVGYLSVAFV